MKKSCLYFDKKYKCVSLIVHYKGFTFNNHIQLHVVSRGLSFCFKKLFYLRPSRK